MKYDAIVLGGGGVIGSCLVKRLRGSGVKTLSVDDHLSREKDFKSANLINLNEI